MSATLTTTGSTTGSLRAGQPRLEARAWLRTVGRPGPERWVWWVAAAGWVALVLNATGWPGSPGSTPMHHHPGASMDGMDMGPGSSAAGPWDGVAHHEGLWVAMVAATMLPLVARNLRSVGLRSPRERRTRATVDVTAGWAVVWLLAGVVVTGAALGVLRVVPSAAVVVATVGVAAAWQVTRVKRVAVARCHRTFAPPLGDGATSACARFGASLGRDCLVTCWPSMVLMTVAGHALLVVGPLAWLSWRDTRRPHNRPGVRTSVTVLVATGAVAILLG